MSFSKLRLLSFSLQQGRLNAFRHPQITRSLRCRPSFLPRQSVAWLARAVRMGPTH